MPGNAEVKPPPTDLTGFWTFTGQNRYRDDILAIRKGHKAENGEAALHGTFTRVRYYRVVTYEFVREVTRKHVLYIFDEDGLFGHFVWNGADAWQSRNEPVTFTVGPNAKNRFAPKGASLKLYPTLALIPYRETNFPRNGTDATRVACPLSQGDPTAGIKDLPQQKITYDLEAGTFEWEQPPERKLRLFFTKVEPQKTAKAEGDGKETWQDTFKGESIPQITLPFVGFDPRNLNLYNLEKVTSGTTPITPPSNKGQQFLGTPIFAYPTLDSYDYVRTDLPHGKFFPLGAWGETRKTKTDNSDTVMISSVAERSSSWSVSLGLSGGIEGLLSTSTEGTYSSEVEHQQKNEQRYSVSRQVGTDYIAYTDIPTLRLHEDFLGEIQSRLKRYMAGETHKLDWQPFINRFGSHYAHAITFGHLDFLETRYTFQAETTAWQKEISLKQNSDATLEKFVKVGRNVAADFKWGGKLSDEISDEHVRHTGVGDDAVPMAIFFDLRPISELFSPVFFPYSPTKFAGNEAIYPKDIEAVAPFVWFGLRKSFEHHLAKLGLNRELEPKFFTDYTPRIVKVTFPYFNIWVDDGHPAVYGDLKLEAINGAVALQTHNIHIDKANRVRFPQGEDFPAREQLSIILAANPKMVELYAGFRITGLLYNYTLPPFYPDDEFTPWGYNGYYIKYGDRQDERAFSEVPLRGYKVGYSWAYKLQELLR